MKESNENKYSSLTDYNCDICEDDGKCLNNENHPDYEKNNADGSSYGGTDLYDCADYSDVLDGKPKGSWMVNWYKNIKKREKYEKENPRQSDFSKWSQSIKKDDNK